VFAVVLIPDLKAAIDGRARQDPLSSASRSALATVDWQLQHLADTNDHSPDDDGDKGCGP